MGEREQIAGEGGMHLAELRVPLHRNCRGNVTVVTQKVFSLTVSEENLDTKEVSSIIFGGVK